MQSRNDLTKRVVGRDLPEGDCVVQRVYPVISGHALILGSRARFLQPGISVLRRPAMAAASLASQVRAGQHSI